VQDFGDHPNRVKGSTDADLILSVTPTKGVLL
jgi:hypothetical protein